MKNTTDIEKATVACKMYVPEAHPEFCCFFDNEGGSAIMHVEIPNHSY